MQLSEITKAIAEKLLADVGMTHSIPELENLRGPVLLGLRQFNNRVGIYDDIIALVTPTAFMAVKGNTDPSRLKPNVAILQPGVYQYKKGLHGIHHLNMTLSADKAIYEELLKTGVDYPHTVLDHAGHPRLLPYWAFRQAGPVLVTRYGQGTPTHDNWPDAPAWIDIHKGSELTTSSLGCQTIHPSGWEDFRAKGYAAMEEYNQSIIHYCLIQLAH